MSLGTCSGPGPLEALGSSVDPRGRPSRGRRTVNRVLQGGVLAVRRGELYRESGITARGGEGHGPRPPPPLGTTCRRVGGRLRGPGLWFPAHRRPVLSLQCRGRGPQQRDWHVAGQPLRLPPGPLGARLRPGPGPLRAHARGRLWAVCGGRPGSSARGGPSCSTRPPSCASRPRRRLSSAHGPSPRAMSSPPTCRTSR